MQAGRVTSDGIWKNVDIEHCSGKKKLRFLRYLLFKFFPVLRLLCFFAALKKSA